LTLFSFLFILSASAIVAALSALLALNMILHGGLSGKHRMARHAWRTCCALLGAVMSFSANTDDYWPDFVNNNILIYLMIGVLVFGYSEFYLPSGSRNQ
jgi:SNF family Na+-dependent transporter